MAKMNAQQVTQARSQLKAAGCPDDTCEALVGSGTPWSVIQAILAFVAANPAIVANVWAFIQAILAGGGIVPAPAP